MTARGLRLVRGWIGAVVATSIAAGSHFLAGGTAPELPLLLLALALSGLACTALTGRGLSLWRLSAGVGLSQGLFHWLFSAAAAPHGSSAPAGGHLAHSSALQPAGTFLSSAADHASPLMWLGHAAAAILTVAILRHGEVAVVRLVQAMRLRVTAFLPLVLPLPVLRPAAVEPPANRPVRPLRNLGAPLLVMRHRGPPLPSLVS